MKKQWFALQVHTGREKWIGSYLAGREVEQLVLLQKENRQWSDRRKNIERPIFPGYVFSRFAMDARAPILSTPGVLRIVGFGRIPVPVSDEEIASLQILDRADCPLQRWPFLQQGDLVRIEGGALDGLVGGFVEEKKGCRIVISVTLLQRSVATEVDSYCVTPIAKPAGRGQTGARSGAWLPGSGLGSRDVSRDAYSNGRERCS